MLWAVFELRGVEYYEAFDKLLWEGVCVLSNAALDSVEHGLAALRPDYELSHAAARTARSIDELRQIDHNDVGLRLKWNRLVDRDIRARRWGLALQKWWMRDHLDFRAREFAVAGHNGPDEFADEIRGMLDKVNSADCELEKQQREAP
jgi:hypothetical protein